MAEIEKCEKCKGSGVIITETPRYKRPTVKVQKNCLSCEGSGYILMET